MMLRWVVLAAALACLAAPVVPLVVPPVITVAAVAAEKAAGKKAPEPEDPPGVVRMSVQAQQGAGIATRTAERRPVMEAVQAPGVVQFDERHVARLRPFVPGRALRLLAQPGDRVTRGQPLVEMDVPGLNDARDRVAAATASLHQAEAELAVALAAQRRGEVLSRDGSLSRAEAERRSAETARARASVETAQAPACEQPGAAHPAVARARRRTRDRDAGQPDGRGCCDRRRQYRRHPGPGDGRLRHRRPVADAGDHAGLGEGRAHDPRRGPRDHPADLGLEPAVAGAGRVPGRAARWADADAARAGGAAKWRRGAAGRAVRAGQGDERPGPRGRWRCRHRRSR